jgi:hypothetical protein
LTPLSSGIGEKMIRMTASQSNAPDTLVTNLKAAYAALDLETSTVTWPPVFQHSNLEVGLDMSFMLSMPSIRKKMWLQLGRNQQYILEDLKAIG